jgi:hypothetical protein
MKKNRLFIYATLLFVSVTIFSCKKITNNTLTGNWLLTGQHNTRININGLIRDTVVIDTSYIGRSQVLEFNSNYTYSLSVYSVTPTTVVSGKYSFSGSNDGTGTLTLTPDSMPPVSSNYVLIPATTTSNEQLIFPTTTSGQGFTESDTTFYTFN